MTKLSASETYLLRLIQANRSKIINMSITQLSELANVSTATIVRTMKKLGYSGYTDFRHTLLNDQTEPAPKYEILRQADNKIKQVILQNEVEVQRTLENMNESTIEDSIQQIHNAKIVYIFARGLSEMIAEEMTLKLQLADKYTQMFRDPNIIITIAKRLKPGAIAIFISLNGETKELVQAARNLSQRDIPIIVFTTNPKGALIKYADCLFLGYTSHTSYFPAYEVHSRLPLQVMSRIMLDAYMVRIKNVNGGSSD